MPYQRAMSTNGVDSRADGQAAEAERRTPLPRPLSGQGFSLGRNQPYHAYQHAPSPVPSSLMPAASPTRPHAHSFSDSSGLSGPSRFLHPSPLRTPPPQASSAPPVAATGHYEMPSSSYSGLELLHVEPIRMPSPRPMHQRLPDASHDHDDPDGTPTAPHQPRYSVSGQIIPEAYARPSSRSETYPHHPPPQELQQGYDPPTQYATALQTSQPYSQAQPFPYRYPDPQHSISPARQPSPAPPPSGGYVPWYQQTSLASNPLPEQPFNHAYDHQPALYGSPVVADSPRRPVPHPPAPQRPQSVGYYPSDELYAEQLYQIPQPAQISDYPPQQYFRPSQDSLPQDSRFYPPHTPQSHTFLPLAHNAISQSLSPEAQYAAPTVPPARLTQAWQSSMSEYNRVASPQPPPSQVHYEPPPQTLTYPLHGYPPHGQTHPQPPLRVSSPQPPLGSTYSAQDDWQSRLALSGPSQPSMPDLSQRAPSPAPIGRQDWRSYMQGLPAPTTPAPLMRSPSPQPPPKDQRTWYTPPPSLPASIRPPEGWRSSLPAQSNGHQWRA